jgi:hypothetical protein
MGEPRNPIVRGEESGGLVAKRGLESNDGNRYYKGMKTSTKSSITLPPNELSLVEALRVQLGAKSKVEVIRRGLALLKETLDRRRLKRAYAQASHATQAAAAENQAPYDLADEGLDEW